MREHGLPSADGTRIVAWDSETPGPPVLLCPGLGTIPEAWPSLLLPSAGVRVRSWYHRGTFTSDRPADRDRIRLDDHVDDALAVLDAAGVRRCVVIGWSMGVMVATRLARRFPDRVSGLLLAAGTPGDLFGGIGGVLGLPIGLRRALAVGAAHTVRGAGPVLDAVLHRVPVNAITMNLLRHSGFMLPGADPDAVAAAVTRFLKHDWRWYVTLALALRDVPAGDLSGIDCPITVLAGRYDLLTDPSSAARAAEGVPNARTRVVPTSHFLPLEAPEVVVEELDLLLDRVDERARRPEPLDALIPPLTRGSRALT
ncbi:pimeloyl-ACP methyl ester carboxylesterase [Herbihabitans rhizosphaerae]|uniref:Pimeloyl-ACP methyl ester carboxylesterase n=1 Tax=Herbihabitans rhizosphaerae TaxID=1872711 RepID=A0A4Q7KR97_9PSEU|nr:alpha/beta hydrolase [Herbihabitans rhizosphaerae]RZS39075.1 pimeloyl-ACP methyl ester carboxylesterase [Herbihabitans rhizosphaerae]